MNASSNIQNDDAAVVVVAQHHHYASAAAVISLSSSTPQHNEHVGPLSTIVFTHTHMPTPLHDVAALQSGQTVQDGTVFFLKIGDDTKKVQVDSLPADLATLHALLSDKFGEVAPPLDETTFHIEHREYQVQHKLEDCSEIYDGSLIEAKSSAATTADASEAKQSGELKRELEDMKKKLHDMENSTATGGNGNGAGALSGAPDNKRQRMGRVRPEVEDDGKLIVRLRGLPYSASTDDIRAFFQGCVIVDDGALIALNMLQKPTGEAYVQFADEASREKALALDGSNIGHRYIDVLKSNVQERERAQSRSKPFDGPVNADSHVIRLRGLPFSASVEDVQAFLGDINTLAVHILSDNLGRASGDAYVEVADMQDADRAMEKHKNNLGNRYIELFRSSHSELTQSMNVKEIGPVNSTSIIVRMRGLPFETTEQEAKDFFRNVDCVAVHFVRDASGRSKGEAFAEFSTPDLSEAAMSYHKQHLGARYVELFRSSAQELVTTLRNYGNSNRMKMREHYAHGPYGGAYGGGYGHQSWGGPQQHGYGGHGHGGHGHGVQQMALATTTCLQIRGIPFSASETDIARFFEEAYVQPIRIHRKNNGGEAYIEFNSPGDCNQAMMMNKRNIGRRYIELFRVSYEEVAKVVGLPPQQQQQHQHQHVPGHPGGGVYAGQGQVVGPQGQGPPVPMSYGGPQGGQGAAWSPHTHGMQQEGFPNAGAAFAARASPAYENGHPGHEHGGKQQW
jgi:heterogeneous nuclear ribonucleoprotein F/H